MPRLALIVFIACAVAAGCGGEDNATESSSATGAQPATTTVGLEADRKRAEIVVLTDADLEPEWEPYNGDPTLVAEIDCLQIEDDDLVLTAHVDGATFSSGGPVLIAGGKIFNRAGHSLISHARLYETEEDAELAFDRFVNSFPSDPVLECLLHADEVPQGPRMKNIRSGFIPIGEDFPALAEDTWRQQYRVRLARDATLIWIDLAVMRENRTLAFLYSSSIESANLTLPTSDEFVQRGAETMAKRLANQR
jgi:hypothetical protein